MKNLFLTEPCDMKKSSSPYLNIKRKKQSLVHPNATHRTRPVEAIPELLGG